MKGYSQNRQQFYEKGEMHYEEWVCKVIGERENIGLTVSYDMS